MTTTQLNAAEKDAIRQMPCGRCRAEPPFADGSKCHTHRPVPERGYVRGNVVPRCPDCHAKEPGHPAMTAFTMKAALTLRRRIRREGMTPAEQDRNRNNGRAARLGGLASKERHRREGLTAKELSRNRRNAVMIAERITPEQRSEINRRGWETRRTKIRKV